MANPDEKSESSRAGASVGAMPFESARVTKPEWSREYPANDPAALNDGVYLGDQLAKAQQLLAYAAESGIDVDAPTRSAVLNGIVARESHWDAKSADDILTALTRLAAKVRPVTTESLAASLAPAPAKKQVRMYSKVIWWLGLFLIPFSIANFCVSRLSEAVQVDLRVAQDLAVKLNNELYRANDQDAVTQRAPVREFRDGVTQSSVIQDLTQFAIAIRAIRAHGNKLNWFVFGSERARANDLTTFELKPELRDLVDEEKQSVDAYQKNRLFAQSVQLDASLYYGAVLNCILPMLYAILGSLAYLLRTFEQQLRQRTFTEADGHSARFAISAIGGFVVGLFNVNIASDLIGGTPQAATVSPLAIAFMVGYAVDVFFSFLEGLIHTFGKPRREVPER
ncbi:MAG TPA: hypothetical protein VGI70_05490 [Polyangiales bacterium]|jgi:hypothetical protein